MGEDRQRKPSVTPSLVTKTMMRMLSIQFSHLKPEAGQSKEERPHKWMRKTTSVRAMRTFWMRVSETFYQKFHLTHIIHFLQMTSSFRMILRMKSLLPRKESDLRLATREPRKAHQSLRQMSKKMSKCLRSPSPSNGPTILITFSHCNLALSMQFLGSRTLRQRSTRRKPI